jgi:hypothetical protein
MRIILLILCPLFSLTITAQPVVWNYFSEETMNEAMFIEMNEYVKRTHNGDSLVLSKVIQEEIMTTNYNLIRENHHLPLSSLHNQKWINDNSNELPDTIKNKIINENVNPGLIYNIYLKDYNIYTGLSYMEILQSSSYPNKDNITYQEVAKEFIRNWNKSPPHSAHMNANYRSKVIVGVASYYNKSTRTVFISFVYVS